MLQLRIPKGLIRSRPSRAASADWIVDGVAMTRDGQRSGVQPANPPDVQQISALEARSRRTFWGVPRVRRSVQGRRLHRALACERMLNCLDLAPFLSN